MDPRSVHCPVFSWEKMPTPSLEITTLGLLIVEIEIMFLHIDV